MPKQFANVMVMSLVAIGVSGSRRPIAAVPTQPSPDDLTKRKNLAETLDNREAKTGAVGSLLGVGTMTLLAAVMGAFLIPAWRKSG